MTLSELKQTVKPSKKQVSDGDNLNSILFQIYEQDLSGYHRQMLIRLNARYDLDHLLPGSMFLYYDYFFLNQLTDIV